MEVNVIIFAFVAAIVVVAACIIITAVTTQPRQIHHEFKVRQRASNIRRIRRKQ